MHGQVAIFVEKNKPAGRVNTRKQPGPNEGHGSGPEKVFGGGALG